MISGGVARRGSVRITVAPKVVGGDPIMTRQDFHRPAEIPDRKIAGQTVDQNHVRTIPLLLIVIFEVLDLADRHMQVPKCSMIFGMLSQKRHKLADGEIAIGSFPKFTQQCRERHGLAIMGLQHFPQDHGVDRSQPQIGEEPRVEVDRLVLVTMKVRPEQGPERLKSRQIVVARRHRYSSRKPKDHAQIQEPRRLVQTFTVVAVEAERRAETRTSATPDPANPTTSLVAGPRSRPNPVVLAAASLADQRRVIRSSRLSNQGRSSKLRSRSENATASKPEGRCSIFLHVDSRAVRSSATGDRDGEMIFGRDRDGNFVGQRVGDSPEQGRATVRIRQNFEIGGKDSRKTVVMD